MSFRQQGTTEMKYHVIPTKSPKERIWPWIPHFLLLIPSLGSSYGTPFPDASIQKYDTCSRIVLSHIWKIEKEFHIFVLHCLRAFNPRYSYGDLRSMVSNTPTAFFFANWQ